MSLSLTRRAALAGAAAIPLAAVAKSASADASAKPLPPTPSRSFKLGDFTVTTLLDASLPRDGAKDIFGGNVSDEEFARVSEENFIPADTAQFYFTPTLVDTGSQKILFDTGLGQGGLQRSLVNAGVQPRDIDIVVITHMHPDHIGGLTGREGKPAYGNAAYVTGRQEFDFWAKMEEGNRVRELVAEKVVPLAENMSFLEDGGEVASGVTAVGAFGHTPGHMAYRIESGGQQLVLTADLANHYVWSFANPDWEVKFDMDKEAAAASRRNILGMLAADRLPMIGYHMPFPAAGYVEARGDGFRFVPVSYQLM